MGGKDSLKECPVITNSCSKAMKASWSSDQSVILILICPGCLSVSHSASYNLDLNLCPPGPKFCWAVGAVLQRHRSFPGTPPSIRFKRPPQTFTTTVRHSVRRLGIARSAGTGSLDGRAGGGGVDDKTYGLCYDVAGQCLIAKAQQEPSFALSV